MGLDPLTAEPLRRRPGAIDAQLLELAAGSGSIQVDRAEVRGRLDASARRPALAFVLARDEVAAVWVDRARRRAQFLAPGLGGAVTIDAARPGGLGVDLVAAGWPVVEAAAPTSTTGDDAGAER